MGMVMASALVWVLPKLNPERRVLVTLVYLSGVPGKQHCGRGEGEPASKGCLSKPVTSVGNGRSLLEAGKMSRMLPEG